MSKKLDKNFKCSKELKAYFALNGFTRSERRDLMSAAYSAQSVERVVHSQLVPLPKGMREPGPGM